MLNTERLCLGCMNDNGGERVCSICGYDSKTQNNPNSLPTRYWLKDRYFIGRVTETNGEGITYIGWDNVNNNIVNVREYYPQGIAIRNSDGSVSIAAGSEYIFNNGIMQFLDLNNKLKTANDLTCLMPVEEVFEGHGTAYCITKATAGITLRDFLIRNGGTLQWEQARPLFLPLMTTVAELNNMGIIHRGISPDTVIVGRDGVLKLTGICIKPVRMYKSDMTVQLFPGYSAIEQYGMDNMNADGPYTDVYGMAATLFRVLMGSTPTDAVERLSNDTMQISAKIAETLPKFILSSLANALQIIPSKRTPDMETFRAELTQPTGESTVVFSTVKEPTVSNEKIKTNTAPVQSGSDSKESKGNAKYIAISASITATVFVLLTVAVMFFTKTGIFGSTVTPDNNNSISESETISNESNTSVESDSSENVSASVPGKKQYQVPNVVGKLYADIKSNMDYTTYFDFNISGKQYSDTVQRGYIISQEQTSDQTVAKGTVINIVVSLGPKEISLVNVSGMSKEQATLELLKQGFYYDNIQFTERYDESKTASAVIETEPAANSKVNTDSKVTVYINAYKGKTDQTGTSSTISSATTR